jgi:hypothetical protein
VQTSAVPVLVTRRASTNIAGRPIAAVRMPASFEVWIVGPSSAITQAGSRKATGPYMCE